MLGLKLVRMAKGLPQWEVAAKANIPGCRLSLIENGRKKPKDEELERLSEVLGAAPEILRKEVQEGLIEFV